MTARHLDAFRRLIPPRPWVAEAECRGVDPDLFFPENGAPTNEAKAVCGRCPVQHECLQYALEAGEKFGVWGGRSEKERRRMRRQRRAAPTYVERERLDIERARRMQREGALPHEIAARLGVTSRTVHRWFNGRAS